MKKLVVSLVILVSNFVSSGVSVCNAKNVVVTSPDGAVTVTVGVKGQHPFYMVNYQNRPLVSPSRLGFLLDYKEVGAHVKMGNVSRDTKDETWIQPWGEDETVRNNYNELTVSFLEKTGGTMRVVFRVFNDGFGFRYILPDYNRGKEYCIQEELTEIVLAHDAKAWSIPSNHTEYFEGIYTSDLLSRKDTVCTPLTIEYEKDLYLAQYQPHATSWRKWCNPSADSPHALAKRRKGLCKGRVEKPLAHHDHQQHGRRSADLALDAEPE